MGLSSEARQIFSWCRRLFPSVLSNWWDIGEKLTYTMFSFIFCFVIFRFCSCRSCQYQNAIGILKLCIAFTVPNTAFQMFSHVFIQKLAFLFRNGEKRTQLIYKSPGVSQIMAGGRVVIQLWVFRESLEALSYFTQTILWKFCEQSLMVMLVIQIE